MPNPFETLEQLIDLGIERVLTSGQEASAEKGITLLKQLNEKANGRITILAGSGIKPSNVKVFKKARLKEIHASASKDIPNKGKSTIFDAIQKESDLETIKAILKTIKE